MANDLDAILPTAYQALNVVSAERKGFITAVARNASMARVAIGQTVDVPIVPAVTSAANTPGMTPPDTGDQALTKTQMAITDSEHVPVRWNGEQTMLFKATGTYDTTLQDQFAEAFRHLSNKIELAIATAAYKASSRAYGTAGTAPFGTANDLSDIAGVLQILEDNGAPPSDLHIVVNGAAMANVRGKQSNLFKANEAGTDQLLRQGIIARLEGFDWHQSSQIPLHNKGTGTGYLVNDGTPPGVDATSITTDTGSGTIIAGDVVTLAGDTNKYIVAANHAANTLTINAPGLRVAADDDDAITVGNNYRPNLAFHRRAIQLATRLPAQPEGGDMAVDSTQVQDPVSGLIFEIALYKLFLQNVYHVRIAWGVKPILPKFIATLLG